MLNLSPQILYQGAITILLIGAILPLTIELTHRHSTSLANGLGAGAALLGSGLGLAGALLLLFGQSSVAWQMSWASAGVNLCLRFDPLAAFFLAPVFLLTGSGALFATGILASSKQPGKSGRHWLYYNLLAVSMALVVVAADSLLFLFAWEGMSLFSFFMVIYDQDEESTRRVGWIYLVATHLSAAFLFLLFFLIYRQTGSTEFSSFATLKALPTSTAVLFFCLALIGFGSKAGLFPMHSWLPEAHAAAPSHVLALMGGVMLKLPVYAFLRFLICLPVLPAWCGLLVTGLGLAGALICIALAALQGDLKRSLAYSSGENVGLIFFGLGLWLYCREGRFDVPATLFLVGALLHVWNHAFFKSLLFFGAGAIIHATGARELSRMGGLLRRMPRTGLLLIIGGGAIAALPPLNGLISEWLLYLGLFQAGQTSIGGQAFIFMLLLVLLVIVGTLVLLAMSRILGIALSGEPRSFEAREAHEVGPAMFIAMAVSAGLCLTVGIAPGLVFPLILGPLALLSPELATGAPEILATLPFGAGWSWTCLLVLLFLAVYVWFYYRLPPGDSRRRNTWIGGLLPSPRMSYTAGGYGQLAQENLLCSCLRPPIISVRTPVFFPGHWQWRCRNIDPIMALILMPLFSQFSSMAGSWRRLQGGQMNIYLAYFFLTTILLLGWAFSS
ncbi:MAG: oxidoreductase [Proteobacteria bacterium]|nr:oxidoreductase [Pseudomonadota bacterium]MBU1714794.1 oxidoreductase [Pseudomonadota bacterium]